MNQPIKTPPMPQRMVSQSGMLSRLLGATNLPNKPMMTPARMTPMISTVPSSNVNGKFSAAGQVPQVGTDPAPPTTQPPQGRMHYTPKEV
jgi:hypothetical protein